MSHPNRDVAEALEFIYKFIWHMDVVSMTKEDLQVELRAIQAHALDSYAEFTAHLGWYDSVEDAKKSLMQSMEEEDPEIPMPRNDQPLVSINVNQWYKLRSGWDSSVVVGLVTKTTDKAYHIVGHMYKGWIPKSQIVNMVIME